MNSTNKVLFSLIVVFVLSCGCCVASSIADSPNGYEVKDLLSFAGNFDLGYRKTQFFESNHNAFVGTWDSRIELWLPPFRKSFSWGPYIRVAGIGASPDEPWENAWLAGPGVGLQVYPFSHGVFREGGSLIGKILGPVRVFVEYNHLDYWGSENAWRPEHQARVGAEYWRNFHANDLKSTWWSEIWSGLYWQSANEFDDHYDTLNFAVSLRSGLRVPDAGTAISGDPIFL